MGASQSEDLLFSVFIKLFAIFIVPYVLKRILSFHICSQVMLLFSINVKWCVDCLRHKKLFIALTVSLNCSLKVIANTYTLLTPCFPHFHNIHNTFDYFFVFFVSKIVRSSEDYHGVQTIFNKGWDAIVCHYLRCRTRELFTIWMTIF